MMNKTPIRVLLVDDHAVVRQGYRHLLEKSLMDVIAEANSGEVAYQQYMEHQPDVVVMDLSMKGIGGLEAMNKILHQDSKAKVLVFSMHDSPIFASRALKAGAMGYVSKASNPDVLLQAINQIAIQNKRFISPDIANAIVQEEDGSEILHDLTNREFEVFQLLAMGLSIEQISTTLNLDYKTIANTQTRLRQKLNVENGSQLVLAAIKFNVLKI